MTKIPDRYFPHRISVRPRLAHGSSTGAKFGPASAPIRALVVDKVETVRDQRADSNTTGEETVSSVHIVLDLPNYIAPGALVTVHAGTPAEREIEVVAAAYNDHPRAPRSAQAWLE